MSARSGYFQGKRGSAALPFFLVLPLRLRSPCRFVRRCHASSGVGCRMCRRRTCALRLSPRPRDSRATALGSSEISSCSAAVLPVVRFVAVPVRAGAAGRIRPADCARRSLPNQGRRQCAADASERLPARGRRAFCGFGRCPECFSAIVSGPRPRPPVGRPEKSLQIGGKGAITGARPGNPPGGCDFSSAGVAQNGKKSYFCSLKQM